MKKALTGLFCSVLIFIPFSSLSISAEKLADEDGINESYQEYQYEYNNMNITTDSKKTEEELERIYQTALSKGKAYNHENNQFNMDDPGDTTRQESPPNYRTIKHALLNIGIDATIGYFARWIPSKLTKSFKGNFVGASILNLTDIPESYFGQWVSSYWSSAHRERRYEATIIEYHTNAFNKVKNIRVEDATHLYR